MKENLEQLHAETYDMLAQQYEERSTKLRPVAEYALSLLTKELVPGSKVLDVGCAVGYTLEILREQGMQPVSIELSPAMADFARMRNPDLEIINDDFFTHPYLDSTYDGVVLSAFIHLFPSDTAVAGLQKVAQILKPNGYAFIGTTKSTVSSEGFESKADYGIEMQRFRKHWTQAEFEEVIKLCNFQIIYNEDITDVFDKVWMDYVIQKC